MTKLLLASTLVLLCVGLASAQLTTPVIFTVESPFVVANTTFPAGTYRISPMSDDTKVFEITGQKGTPSVLFQADPIETSAAFPKTEVVFNKYAEHLVLKEVTLQGSNNGISLQPSLTETKHAKDHGQPTKVRHPART